LLTGLACFMLAVFVVREGSMYDTLVLVSIAFGLMAVPLGDINYPVRFNKGGSPNTVPVIMVSLALVTIILAFINKEAASMSGALFLIVFVLNNWIGVFKR
jgi:hypothetical protein